MADNNIQLLVNSGFDAFSNLYDVEISPPSILGGVDPNIQNTYKVRALDFKPVNLTLGEYKAHYKTVDLTRLNAQFTGEREFSIRFRVDANWRLYALAKKWKALYSKISTDEVYLGTLSDKAVSDPNQVYGYIKVYGYKSATGLSSTGSKDDQLYWEYKQVMLYDVVEPQFTRATSNPVDIECKFLFGEHKAGSVVDPVL